MPQDGVAVDRIRCRVRGSRTEPKFRRLGRRLRVAGVHIVRGKPGDAADCHARWVQNTLQAFCEVFSVPVLILGVDPD
jgi:hypothetical protein